MNIKKLREKYRKLPIHVRASFWFLICAFLQKGMVALTIPIFTRLMSTEEYGQFTVFTSWENILTIFVSLNLYSGMYSQGLIKFEDERKTFISSLQGLCFVFFVGWVILYLLFQETWNQILGLPTVQVLSMLVLIWASAVFQFWAVEQRVEIHYQRLVVVTVFVAVIRPVLGIIFVIHSKDKVTARIISMVLVDVSAYVGLFIIQLRRGKHFCVPKFWKYALRFNVPLIPHYLSMSILTGADRIMIKRYVSESAAGIYGLAYSISMIMTLFNTALVQTLEPWLFQKIKAKRIADIGKVAYPCFLLIAAVNLLLIAMAPEVIALFAPPAYYDAIWIIPPVAMSVFFMFLYTFFSVFEFYYEKTKLIAIASMAGAVLNIILNNIFIPYAGYIVAGYTTLVCYILYAMCHYCFMRRICKKHLDNQQPYSMRILLNIIICFILIGFILLATYSTVWVRYLMIAGILGVLLLKRRRIMELIGNLTRLKEVVPQEKREGE